MHSSVPESGIEWLRAVKTLCTFYFPRFFRPQSSWGLNPAVHQIHNLCCLPRRAYLDPSTGKFPAFTCFIAGCALPYLLVIQSFPSFLSIKPDVYVHSIYAPWHKYSEPSLCNEAPVAAVPASTLLGYDVPELFTPGFAAIPTLSCAEPLKGSLRSSSL